MCAHVLQTKKRYAKEWAEAEKATQQAEKTENDLNATRLDVDKVNTRVSSQKLGTNFFKMSISFLTVCVSLFFVAVCAPVCLISFFASVPAHLPICILFCIVHPFIFYSLSPLSHCLSPALKAKQHAHSRTHTAEECRNDYAAELQKYNKEQNFFYYTEIPQIFNVRPTQMHTFPMQ